MLCWIGARDSSLHSTDFFWEDGRSATDFGSDLDKIPSLQVDMACPKSQTGLCLFKCHQDAGAVSTINNFDEML